MPDTKPRDEWTADDYAAATEPARRASRYRFARERIKKIVDGMPPLTDEELARLAVLLHGGSDAT